MNHYQYQNLPSLDSFRVLELLPGNTDDDVHVILKIVDFNTDIPYEAISYCWGSTALTCSVRVDDHLLPITQSLHEALRAFRRPQEPRVVWADAICINQNN